MPDKLAKKDTRTHATKAAHDRSLFKLKTREMEAFAACDFQSIIADLSNGVTQGEIAKRLGVAGSTLSIGLNTIVDPAKAKAVELARKAGADALADRALQALEDADTDSSGSCTIAGLKAKHFQWRAALADRTRFQERRDGLDNVTPPTAIPSFTIQIMPSGQTNITQQADVIDVDPEN